MENFIVLPVHQSLVNYYNETLGQDMAAIPTMSYREFLSRMRDWGKCYRDARDLTRSHNERCPMPWEPDFDLFVKIKHNECPGHQAWDCMQRFMRAWNRYHK